MGKCRTTKTAAPGSTLSNKAASRTYKYNRDDLQHLFAAIIESLSQPDETGKTIGRILTEVCTHFRFGCGFIYEIDHRRIFHLKERFSAFDAKHLPESFELENHLGVKEIEKLIHNSLFYQQTEGEEPVKGHTRIFESNTFLLVPVTGKDPHPIGLVGMMDRRRNILLDDQAVQAAKMVLGLLANSIKIRLYQKRLQSAQQTLVSILDNTGIDIYVNDFHTHEILYVNKSMAAPYGGRKNMLGKKCWQALYTDKSGPCDYCPQNKLIDEEGNPTKIYSWDYRRPFDGSWFRVLSATFRWFDGRLAHVVSSVDITENKNNEATIAQMADYDALTNLPNRRKLLADCDAAIEEAIKNDGHGYLLFFDLDKFKDLNDSMGHQAGDQLLQEVGKALQKNRYTRDRSFRYGGDEFVVLLPDTTEKQAHKVVQFLLARFQRPWRLKRISPICHASVGVARYPEQGKNTEELLHKADSMMYKAKQAGRGTACFYTDESVKLI